jgi:hypothetical protein
MPLLPSGTHYCINSQPLDEFLRLASNSSGLHIPDLLLIQGPDDLRAHIRLLWLLPLGSDCAVNPPLNPLSQPTPEGLTLVDSGYRMNQLPGHLDESDRCAMALFWESPRCRAFLGQLIDKVQRLQNDLITTASAEDILLNQWLTPTPELEPPSPSPSPAEALRRRRNQEATHTLQAEEKAEQAASFIPQL